MLRCAGHLNLGADIGTFTYDGDTPQDARKSIRSRAHVVVTNPDMLHKGILPRTRPSRFQRVQMVGIPVSSEWRIQLPNGVSVAFSGSVDAGSLTTVLRAAATVE